MNSFFMMMAAVMAGEFALSAIMATIRAIVRRRDALKEKGEEVE